MRIISIFITVLIILFGIAFTLLNAKTVEVNYLIGSSELPLAVILLISMAMGVLLCFLITGFSVIKLMAKNKWLATKLKHFQEKATSIQH